MIGIRGAFYSVIALGFARRLLEKLRITPGRPDKADPYYLLVHLPDMNVWKMAMAYDHSEAVRLMYAARNADRDSRYHFQIKKCSSSSFGDPVFTDRLSGVSPGEPWCWPPPGSELRYDNGDTWDRCVLALD